MSLRSYDHMGLLQLSIEPFFEPSPIYYVKQYGFMLYCWCEKSYNSFSKPLFGLNIEHAVLTDVVDKSLSWAARGPHLSKLVTFTANNMQAKEEWMDSMRNADPSHTVELDVECSMESGGIDVDKGTTIFSSEPGKKISLDDFVRVAVLGKGAYGSVCQVRKIDTNEDFAMKIMNKELIECQNVSLERFILEQMDHPFVVKLHYAFQTEGYLYIVLDLLAGGELFYHLGNNSTFDEPRAKFYAAEIGLAIGYLHSKNIIYRDLKPENVVLDKDGHACLTDFGLAKANIGANATTSTYCGTAEYQAPEVLLGEEHGQAVDWWSLGIMLYEMLYGIPPFYHENENIMHENILIQDISFDRFGITISHEAENLLTRLLERDPVKRLHDVEEFKKHPFFSDIDFQALYERKVPAPFLPDSEAANNFDSTFTTQSLMLEDSQSYSMAKNYVDGFTYDSGNRKVEEPRQGTSSSLVFAPLSSWLSTTPMTNPLSSADPEALITKPLHTGDNVDNFQTSLSSGKITAPLFRLPMEDSKEPDFSSLAAEPVTLKSSNSDVDNAVLLHSSPPSKSTESFTKNGGLTI